MSAPFLVQIVGAPVACADGVRDTWREVAAWSAEQLYSRFGDAIEVVYYDLFDPSCPVLPSDAQLPIVLIDGTVFSSGGKVNIPAIRRHLEEVEPPSSVAEPCSRT